MAAVVALFFSEQVIQGRSRLGTLAQVGCHIGTRPGFEEIAKIGVLLVAHFFGRRFAAMLGFAGVIVDAQFADMQLRAALGAFVQSAQRQAEFRQRDAAFPTL